jgi:hypothetical protein
MVATLNFIRMAAENRPLRAKKLPEMRGNTSG